MVAHSTPIRPACKTRAWLVPVIAAVLALGATQRASAQSDAHALMEGLKAGRESKDATAVARTSGARRRRRYPITVGDSSTKRTLRPMP